MSGGSFNYLCYAHENAELSSRRDDIERMYQTLIELGHYDVAAKTDLVKFLLDKANEEANDLSLVWQAVEWFVSHDYGEDQVKEAVEQYRADMP